MVSHRLRVATQITEMVSGRVRVRALPFRRVGFLPPSMNFEEHMINNCRQRNRKRRSGRAFDKIKFDQHRQCGCTDADDVDSDQDGLQISTGRHPIPTTMMTSVQSSIRHPVRRVIMSQTLIVSLKLSAMRMRLWDRAKLPLRKTSLGKLFYLRIWKSQQ